MPVETSAKMQQSHKEKRHSLPNRQQSEPFPIEERGVIGLKGKG
jgi:hypothetical protein